MLFGDHLLKLLDVLEVWDELDGVAAAVKSSRPYHSHVTHRIACSRPSDVLLLNAWYTTPQCFSTLTLVAAAAAAATAAAAVVVVVVVVLAATAGSSSHTYTQCITKHKASRNAN